MNWLTAIWSMATATCLTLAGVHLLIWTLRRRDGVHLLFALMALGAAGAGLIERLLLHTTSIDRYSSLLRWQHLNLCRGECPENRLVRTSDGEIGLNYLCPGLKKFYAHIQRDMPEIPRRVRKDGYQ